MKYNQPYGGATDAPYVNGNPAIGLAGSIPPAASIEYPQRELVNLINDVALATATDSDLHQVAKAIQSQKLISKDDAGTANAYAVTLVPAPTAYFKYMTIVMQVLNTNTGASVINVNGLGAKGIKHRDGSDLISGELPALSIVSLVYDGTAFQLVWSNVVAGAPVFLTSNRIFYVNDSTGNDTTLDGTTATVSGSHGPFKTCQRAANEVIKYNLNGFNITINVANGTYTGASTVSPLLQNMPTGAGVLVWVGNNATPTNVVLVGVNATACQISGPGSCVMSGFKFTSSGSNPADPCAGVFTDRVRLTMSEVNFGFCSGYMVGITRGGTLVMSGNWTLSGSSTGNAYSSGGFISCFFSAGVETSPTIAPLFITASVAISLTAFVTATQFGAINLTWTTFTNPGNVNGIRYQASLNGVISSGGGGANYYPGNIAGTLTTGGQYA